MMKTVKQSDEELLQGTWVRVRFSEPHEGYSQGVYVVEFPMHKFSHKERDVAVSLAAAFTRERLEQVRQLREEIAAVREQQREWAGCHGEPELLYYACWTRILARLESILAGKLTGMKAGA